MIERIASCLCGQVQCQAVGEPILSAVCYCDDCQAGGRQIETLPNSATVRDAFGGTPYLTYRTDRFRCVKGENLLKATKNGDEAPTTRFVASCCNSGMFLKYGPGWWISAYRVRFTGDLPPIEMRNQIKFLPADVRLPDDVPTYRSFPPKLFARLLAARLAMWVGR